MMSFLHSGNVAVDRYSGPQLGYHTMSLLLMAFSLCCYISKST